MSALAETHGDLYVVHGEPGDYGVWLRGIEGDGELVESVEAKQTAQRLARELASDDDGVVLLRPDGRVREVLGGDVGGGTLELVRDEATGHGWIIGDSEHTALVAFGYGGATSARPDLLRLAKALGYDEARVYRLNGTETVRPQGPGGVL